MFITGVKTKVDLALSANTRGGSRQVYKGEYRGQQVALKVLHKGRKEVSAFFSPNNTDFIL